jgi:GAF domain-containing protein
MLINFECKKCHHVFDCDVGLVSMLADSNRPHFEKGVLCPTCGEVTIDDVWLTELGQSQLTEATLDFAADFGDFAESQCQGCDLYLPVNDLNLCDECASKLDRDLIRHRDWDYSTSAFGLDPSLREELYRQVIAQYGEKLELIASSKEILSSARKKRKRRKKKRG